MASANVVLAQSPFNALSLGRSDQFVVGRLLRFWDSKNVKKQGEFMGITLLLLDEKDSVIHGFITAARSPYYRPFLKTGSVVRVSRFEVAKCTNMYKITEHPYMICFIPQTTIHEVTDNAPTINGEKFMLRKFDPLRSLANTNLELPDVVGQIQSVQGSDLTDARVTSRVVVRFVIDPQVVVNLSLWDDAASVFRGLLNSGDKAQSVMVVTTVNPKLFGGNLYLNSTPATKFYFDPTIEAIAQLTASLGGPAGEGFTCIDTKNGIKKKELVSIGELNKFVSNSNEQEADFICKARVVEVLQENGWSFVSCTGCSKKLEKIGNSLRCSRCVSPNVTGVIKYRVELCVDDGVDNATFVVFDREMVKITKQDAADLALTEMNGGEGEELPKCVRDLAGKEFVFQIRVTPFNFTPSHRTFTVSTITDSIAPETFKTDETEVDAGEGSKGAASVGKKVDTKDIGPLDAESAKGSRKRPRE